MAMIPEIVPEGITISVLQARVASLFSSVDATHGPGPIFLSLVEEIGELASAVKLGSQAKVREELADSLIWLLSLAHLYGIDAGEAIEATLRDPTKRHAWER